MRSEPIYKRFWETLDQSGECWLWTGAKGPTGYGHMIVAPKRHGYSHRFAWELTNGAVPDGMFVLHHCDVRCCCRPDHLFIGTAADNTRDMVSKGRCLSGQVSRWHKNPETTTGVNNPKAKLTEETVLAIRALRRTTTLSYKQIGQRFGVAAQTAWNADKVTWRHLA